MRINSLIAALVLSTASLVGCATSDTDDTSDADSNSTAAGKFDMWQSNDGWHFHLTAGNGATLLTSEAYTSRTGAINGILSVENNGVENAQYQVVQGASGGYLIHLVAGNNEIISFSQVYSSKSNATRAVTSCVKAVTTYLDKAEANTTGARAQVEAGATNQFRFNIFASNGQIILSSESYTTEAAAWNGAFAVQDAAATAASFKLLTAADGRFYFTLTAENGQVVGISQMYTTQLAAQAGIKSVTSTLAKLDIL
jgi:uncharacterized protein YegP (UPF0339 family)